MFRWLLLGVLLLAAGGARAQDPLHSDPDKYRLILENERVRVLEYSDLPGERTLQHDHPAFVLYAVGPFERRIILPDGTVLHRRFEEGDVIWSDAQTHIGENVGSTPTHAIIVELK